VLRLTPVRSSSSRRPSAALPAGRGVVALSTRQVTVFACPDCGHTWRIIVVNGEVLLVERERD
jgi:hypothetical protein